MVMKETLYFHTFLHLASLAKDSPLLAECIQAITAPDQRALTYQPEMTKKVKENGEIE